MSIKILGKTEKSGKNTPFSYFNIPYRCTIFAYLLYYSQRSQVGRLNMGLLSEEIQMCGIVAYLGQKRAQPILVEGLKRLEYRGYDSADVALLADRKIKIKKTSGRITALEAILPPADTGETADTIAVEATRPVPLRYRPRQMQNSAISTTTHYGHNCSCSHVAAIAEKSLRLIVASA